MTVDPAGRTADTGKTDSSGKGGRTVSDTTTSIDRIEEGVREPGVTLGMPAEDGLTTDISPDHDGNSCRSGSVRSPWYAKPTPGRNPFGVNRHRHTHSSLRGGSVLVAIRGRIAESIPAGVNGEPIPAL